MTTQDNAGALTDKEGEDIFYKAFSETLGKEFKPSVFRDESNEEAPVVVDETVPETPPVTEERPTEEVENKETPADKKAPEQSAAKPPVANSVDSLLEQFPEDKRDLVKQIVFRADLAEQRYRSHQGRLAAERKQRQALEQELVKLRTRSAPPQDAVLAEQTKADFEKSISGWKEVSEAEPTLAKAIDALTDAKVKSAEARVRAELESRDELYTQYAQEDEKQHEMNMLLEIVPNALDVIRSQEFQYWKANVAAPGLRNLADNSINHQDAILVLQQYAPWALELDKQRNPPQAPQDTPPAADTTVADKISNSRKDKVSPVVTGPKVKPAVTPEVGHEFDDDTADRLFLEYSNKIRNKK